MLPSFIGLLLFYTPRLLTVVSVHSHTIHNSQNPNFNNYEHIKAYLYRLSLLHAKQTRVEMVVRQILAGFAVELMLFECSLVFGISFSVYFLSVSYSISSS